MGTRKNRLAEAVLTSTHNLCFWAEIKKNNVHPFKPQFYCIKVGFQGIKIIQVCFRNEPVILLAGNKGPDQIADKSTNLMLLIGKEQI